MTRELVFVVLDGAPKNILEELRWELSMNTSLRKKYDIKVTGKEPKIVSTNQHIKLLENILAVMKEINKKV